MSIQKRTTNRTQFNFEATTATFGLETPVNHYRRMRATWLEGRIGIYLRELLSLIVAGSFPLIRFLAFFLCNITPFRWTSVSNLIL